MKANLSLSLSLKKKNQIYRNCGSGLDSEASSNLINREIQNIAWENMYELLPEGGRGMKI